MNGCSHYRADPSITYAEWDGARLCLDCVAAKYALNEPELRNGSWRYVHIYLQVTEARAQKASSDDMTMKRSKRSCRVCGARLHVGSPAYKLVQSDGSSHHAGAVLFWLCRLHGGIVVETMTKVAV